ncbi:class I SAM-dependent methyltransferase [Dermacoccus abyssi]|uniref:class I SAM-dependent methyltransferase n=1 Tax=Dermacoccus abyssi TaxID=322596 RepID=UPI002AD368C9|nr:class I SAM-dependent methyltransferase [Dermacoccus abyssi]
MSPPRADAATSARTWSSVGEGYRRSFATLCAGPVPTLLAHVAPAMERRSAVLLDVGSGTGTVARAAAGRGWRVLALDPEADMASMTRDALNASDEAARVMRAGLPNLPLTSAGVDAVVANFVVNHVADPRAALGEAARVVRPGGLLALTIWTPGSAGWADLVGAAFEAADATAPPSAQLPEHLDFERSPEGLADITRAAGLFVVVKDRTTWRWRVSPDDLWAGISSGVAAAGARYLAQTPDVRRAVQEHFVRLEAAEAHDGLLNFASEATLVVATKPSAPLTST